MTYNDSLRVDIDQPMQDTDNVDDTLIPSLTLQDCGTHRNLNKNSICKHDELIGLIGWVKEDQFYYCEYMIFNGLVFEF